MVGFAKVLMTAALLAAPGVALAGAAGVSSSSPAVSSSSPAVSSSASSPRDMSTGMAAGKRMHKPFTITKDWSNSAEATADCIQLHGTVSTDATGKMMCVGDVDGDGMNDLCTRASAMGAMCKP
jgi:hypothetical protein